MNFKWLKKYVPRSLYGRAALILVLPVVTLQLVVSVVFIQRHFEGVTTQMTRSLSHELQLVFSEIEKSADMDDALARVGEISNSLEMGISIGDVDDIAAQRRWYDFSGTVVTRELHSAIPEIAAVQLPDDNLVRVIAELPKGVTSVEFDRGRVSASNPHQLLVNMAFFGVLMTLIAFIYLRNQLRPITRLAAAADAFGRGRHVNYSPAGAIEVRAAGNAFLDMRARIERQIEQRTMLLSGVSHDLRTPLTRLRLGLSFLTDEEREPMERDVEDMQRMLDEFLSFARSTADVTPEPVEFCTFIQEVVATASRGKTGTYLERCDVVGTVTIRKMVVQRALENLINNALRYGQTVQVNVFQMKKSIIIRIEDDGPGIPEAQREEALKPFARLEPARNQNKGSGVGLGMSIAADAARAHGGVLRLGKSATLGGLQADLIISK